MNKMGNKGFMLLETLIVSTIILCTLVFLYIQFSNIKTGYDTSFKYNTIPGLYAADEINKFLNEFKISNELSSILNNDSNGYLNIKSLEYYKSRTNNINDNNIELYKKLINYFEIDKIIYTDDDLERIKTYLNSNNCDPGLFDEEFKKYIKNLMTNSTENDRLIIKFNDNTFSSILLGGK